MRNITKINGEQAFWENHVLTGVPPKPTTLTDAPKRCTQDDGGIITVDADIEAVCTELNDVKASQKAINEHRNDLEQALMEYIGSHSELVSDSGKSFPRGRRKRPGGWMVKPYPPPIQNWPNRSRLTAYRVYCE